MSDQGSPFPPSPAHQSLHQTGAKMTQAEVSVRVRELYGENEQMRQETVRVLRAWLRQQPHLICWTEEEMLIDFARGCKYSLEKTKRKIDTFLTLRTALPEFFRGWDPLRPELQAALAVGGQLPLPGRDHLGRKVVVIRGGTADPRAHKPEDLEKANMMVMETLVKDRNDDMFVMGMVIVVDMHGMTMAHLTSKPVAMVKKLLRFVQDALPFSPKAILFVRTGSLFTAGWALVKPILNDKMKSRVQVLGDDFQMLQKTTPKENLPKDYGGDGPTLDELAVVWKEKVESERDFLMAQEEYGTDESRRPGQPKTAQELFGIEGSFRKLDID